VNIKEYISSGILEAYVLGQLSAAETAELEKHLSAYPELKQELAKVEDAQKTLLMAMAVAPPVTVKKELFEKIDQQGGHVVEMNTESARPWKFAVAASISVALISSFLAYNYWNKWQSTSNELTNLIAMNQRVAKDYNQVNKRLEELANDVRVMDNPAFSRVVMKGTEQAPEAIASVYWNANSQEVYLRIQNMKELAADNQYQLWAIIDGKPVDAGVFDVNDAGLIKMKNIAQGATNFAVTIEPRGGKASPSLETMQVIGTVQKSS
jgi:anti-sigma-K factor RskA